MYLPKSVHHRNSAKQVVVFYKKALLFKLKPMLDNTAGITTDHLPLYMGCIIN